MTPLSYLKQLLPIIGTQLLIRAFHSTDLRLIGGLGPDLQLTHAIQYNFNVLGQFLGVAGLSALLALWKNLDSPQEKGSFLLKIIQFTTILMSALAIISIVTSNSILRHFQISETTWSLARVYMAFGWINAILLSIQISMDGALLAVRKQKFTLLNTVILSLGNLTTDWISVHAFKTGMITLPTATLLFAGGTMLWLIFGILISKWILRFEVAFIKVTSETQKNSLPIYKNEIIIAITRAVAPIVYAFQIGFVKELGSFLITYQSALHLAFFATLPLSSGLPIAVRDYSQKNWLAHLIFLAALPTLCMYIICITVSPQLIHGIFKTQIPAGYENFLKPFFMGCIIGQVGHLISIPLRARLMNRLIVWCLVLSEFLVNNIGLAILISLKMATPSTLGYLTMGYATLFTVMMKFSLDRKKHNSAPI